jgi:serine/threonine-protein kinase
MKCPNCGLVQAAGATDCSGCGVNFAKMKIKASRAALAEPLRSEDPTPADFQPSEDALKQVQGAAIAGFVLAGLNFIIWLVVMSGVNIGMGLNAFMIIDVFLILGLSFGVLKRSRVCAVLLLLYFVGGKILMMASGQIPGIGGIAISIAFATAFFKGMLGTFSCRKD